MKISLFLSGIELRINLPWHYALDGLDDRIFVAEYRAKLPSEEEIREEIEKIA